MFIFLLLIYNKACDQHVFQQSPGNFEGKKQNQQYSIFIIMCEYIIIRHQKGKKSLPSNPLKRNYHRLCEIKRHIFTYHIHVFQSTYKRACHREQCIMQNVFFYRLYSSDWSIPDTIKTNILKLTNDGLLHVLCCWYSDDYFRIENNK